MKNNIKLFREQLSMSQEELAEKSNVSRTTIHYLESGKALVTKTDTLRKISEALGKNVTDVFFTEEV